MIYTVTLFEKAKIEPLTGLPTFGDTHCLGYFDNLEDAVYSVSCILQNEFYYQYCIIEEFANGLNPFSKNRYLYKWSNRKRQYVQIDEPRLIHMVTNFAIG